MTTSIAQPGRAARFSTRLYQTGSIIALTAATQIACAHLASAQAAEAAQAAQIEEIVVSGSRVITDGLQAPVPVTVVTFDALKDVSPGDLGIALSKSTPQLSGNGADGGETGTSSTAGQTNLSVRNSGGGRTLTLLDGRRVVGATSTGSADINLFPQSLIQRVDIVTGGASAAYGSDAIGGVINFIVDKSYEGVKVETQAGISQYGDKFNFKTSANVGTSFGDGRGHALFSIEHSEDDGLSQADRGPNIWPHAAGWATIANPGVTAANRTPQNPQQVTRPNVSAGNGTCGGAITTGALAFTSFGPGGVPQAYDRGDLSVYSQTTKSGGDGCNGSLTGNLFARLDRTNTYGRISYDITDNMTAFVEGIWAGNHVNQGSQATYALAGTGYTIFSGNPFIPAAIQATMTAKNIASFVLGRINSDFVLRDQNAQDQHGALASLQLYNRTVAKRIVGGIDGTFGDGWAYEASYNWGRSNTHAELSNDPVLTRMYMAVDAVRDTTGRIVCRASLDPATVAFPDEARACVPLNPFGEGSPSQGSLNFFLATNFSDRVVTQQVGEFSVTGQPFATWAGPVGVAFGAEYRSEDVLMTASPFASRYSDGTGIRGYPVSVQNKTHSFERGLSQLPLDGRSIYKEGFVEAEIPLARDASWAKSLNLNAAGRYAHFSRFGWSTTWKLGAVYQPVEDLRFRGSRSKDMAAPSVEALYALFRQTAFTFTDPFRNFEQYTAATVSGGNPNLEPELGYSSTFGVVYQPSWLSGLGASVDYYHLKITNEAGGPSGQDLVDGCYDGTFPSYCQYIHRAPTVGGVPGLVTTVDTFELNGDISWRSGLDFELNYSTALSDIASSLDGDLNMRLVASYVLGTFDQSVGEPKSANTSIGTARVRANFSLAYSLDRFNFSLNERYVSSSLITRTAVPGQRDENVIPAWWQTNVNFRYAVGENEQYEYFLNISNVFNRKPPRVSSYRLSGTVSTQPGCCDTVGRAFIAGLRAEF